MKEELLTLIDTVSGTVGMAFVSAEDTVLINNDIHYPMMSVFKLHEALAVADRLEKEGRGMDSLLNISVAELDRETWSPMLKEYGSGDFSISVKALIDYSLISSDNNASNLLFTHIVSPAETDRFIKSVVADTCFNIIYSEAEMKKDHELSILNCSSPLSAALLIRSVFIDDIVSPENQEIIKEALSSVVTGQNRLGAVIDDAPNLFFAHKTGSGYRKPNGELIAHNDIGYFRLPDGRDYSLAVMIRDYAGSENDASSLMSEISRIVYRYFTAHSDDSEAMQ